MVVQISTIIPSTEPAIIQPTREYLHITLSQSLFFQASGPENKHADTTENTKEDGIKNLQFQPTAGVVAMSTLA